MTLAATPDATKMFGEIKGFVAWVYLGMEERTSGQSDCIYPFPSSPLLLASHDAVPQTIAPLLEAGP